MAISTERDGAVDADAVAHDDLPEGITSLLDTDLYKLTMQCAVLKYFPDVGMFSSVRPHLPSFSPSSRNGR